MEKLIPVLLPAFLGLVAGISHGVVSDYMNVPTSLGQTTPAFLGQSLND
ncbi:MAG: hypothetical protein AAFO84_13300 [Cyanobacteria bacterium J06598_1]